jgi:acyl-CoA dehydrogenase
MCDLAEQTRAIKRLVRQLVDRYTMPMERKYLRGETITQQEHEEAQRAAKEVGLWGLAVPEEYGGAALNTLDNAVVCEESNRCLITFPFGGRGNALLLGGTAEQKEKYLYPLLRGEKTYAFAQTEPSGGSDPGGMMQTTAVRDGDVWIINGSKIFISGAGTADFLIVMAVTDKDKRQRGGITAFLVDRDTPGLKLVRPIPIAGHALLEGARTMPPWDLLFEDCVVPHSQVIGEVGGGFRLAQQMLSTERMNIGAQCVGIADRCLQMMTAYAKQRVLFGEPIAAKQGIQNMLVDSAIDVHTTRLLTYDAASKNDRGDDTRVEAGMLKLVGTEMAARVVDRAIQIHGGYGVSTELPFTHWANRVRMMRIFEGPSEVQRYQIVARALLR